VSCVQLKSILDCGETLLVPRIHPYPLMFLGACPCRGHDLEVRRDEHRERDGQELDQRHRLDLDADHRAVCDEDLRLQAARQQLQARYAECQFTELAELLCPAASC